MTDTTEPRRRDTPDAQETVRTVLRGVPAMIGYWDRDLRNVMANDAYVTFFGKTPAQLHGMHIRDLLGPELYAKNRPYMDRALAGEEQLFDREIVTPSGELRYTQASYIPDRADDGEIRGFFVLVTDITERHQAEVALHASEERYRTLIEHLPRSAITLVDPELRLAWLSGRSLAEAGVDAETLVGRPIAETSGGGAHGDTVAALYARALAGEEVTAEVSSKVIGRDFSVEIAPLRDRSGTVTAALGVAQDITERRRQEAALELHRQLVEHMAEGTMVVRADDLVIVQANATTERMFGYGPGELIGAHVSCLYAEADEAAQNAMARSVRDHARAAEDGGWTGEIPSLRKDGSTFWRRSAVSTFEHPDHGRVLVSVIADITEERERESEQRALAEIATLVAEGVGPAAVFTAVAEQIRSIFEARAAAVTRFDGPTGEGVMLGGVTSDGTDLSGTRLDLAGTAASARVFRTGAAARVDAPPDAPPFDPAAPGRFRYADHGGIAAPIVVGGALWGCVGAVFAGRPVPEAAELRLARFAKLAGLAIANAQSWDTLARQASTDALTGLANHRTFHARLREEVERAARYGRSLSLALFDIDHFKQVNDEFGHQAGDRVLAEVARRLSLQSREGELVARIGGEEFGWLMPETGEPGAVAAAERARLAVGTEPFENVGPLTISAGVCSTADGHDAEELVRRADEALYDAKDGGRDRTRAFSDRVQRALDDVANRADRSQTMSSVRALARAIDSKDRSTNHHSERVAHLAERLALELGWTTKRARQLHACGLLHDVGKIGIPDEVLLKPGRLDAAEYAEVKRHAELSAAIASEVLEHEQVRWIRSHHERWDGGGYPDGLRAEEIADGALLLAIADAWDVMTQTRTYKAARTEPDALAECRRERGRQFAPAAVDALLALAERGELVTEPAA